MSASHAVGYPGERIRLDLTLGTASVGDGIPDAWKEAQLLAAGLVPGDPGWDLSRLSADGDFDGDGVSNYKEFIAGTFAVDSSDYLYL